MATSGLRHEHEHTALSARTALAVICALSTLIAVLAFASNPPEADAQGSWLASTLVEDSGDVDCDGELTTADSSDVLVALAGLSAGAQSCGANGALGANLGRADLDLDGAVSVRDALIIAQCAAAAGAAVECPPEPAIAPFMGDVNCDGQLDESDATAIERLRLGLTLLPTLCPGDPTTIDLTRADLTSNGVVTSADAAFARMCIAAHARPHSKGRVNFCPRTGTEVSGRIGDVNCDAFIDQDDVDALDEYVAGSRPGVQSCPADSSPVANLLHSEVNSDARVTSDDARLLSSCLSDHNRYTCVANTAPPTTPLPPPNYEGPTMGDVDCNGRLDPSDAIAAAELVQFGLRRVLGCDSGLLSPSDPSRGDLDRDGLLTVEDVGLLFECASGLALDQCPTGAQIALTADIDRDSPAIGDVNCDGRRTIDDVAALQALLERTALASDRCGSAGGEVNVNRGDVTGDNVVTIADVQTLRRCVDNPTGNACPPISCGAAEAVVAQCSYDNRILSLRFLPPDPADPTMLDPWALSDYEAAVGFQLPLDELLQDIERFEAEGVPLIEGASKYRGWQDPSAEPAVRLSIDAEITLYERPPLGLEAFGARRPDYIDILNRPGIDICDRVDNDGIDEVWMWSMHTERIVPVESNLSSRIGVPFIDISNSERTDDLPHCSRSYVLYNFNFRTGSPNMLHNRGHHMEAWLNRQARDRQVITFDGYFGEGDGGYETLAAPLGFYRCGNVHRSLNSPAIALPGQPEENNWVDRPVASDCKDWVRTGGSVSIVNCSDWFEALWDDPACFDDGGASWVSWWFQNLPGLGNGMVDEGRQWRNLHAVIGDPDSLIMSRTFLFETEELRPPDDPFRRFDTPHHFVTHELD